MYLSDISAKISFYFITCKYFDGYFLVFYIIVKYFNKAYDKISFYCSRQSGRGAQQCHSCDGIR